MSARHSISALDPRMCNPFNDKTQAQMKDLLIAFFNDTGIDEIYRSKFEVGMYLAQDEKRFDDNEPESVSISEQERRELQRDRIDTTDNPQTWWETTEKWKLPWRMWSLVIVCALAAVVQGMDQSSVNAAQFFYQWDKQLGVVGDLASTEALRKVNHVKLALLNSAPYLCCVGSCLLTHSLNAIFGRRKTIFLCCFFSAVFAFGQAFSKNWHQMLIIRFCLGFGIGPKSSTVPIYAAETSPQNVRGGLVMMWQMFTAMGIMLGYLAGIAFKDVGACSDYADNCSLRWRLILGSPTVAPLIVMALILYQPESPRWSTGQGLRLMADRKGHRNHNLKKAQKYFQDSFSDYLKLRATELQATRDMFLTYHQLKSLEIDRRYRLEHAPCHKRGSWELLSNLRSRNAFLASLICVFSQQLCGVNVIVYYSTIIIEAAKPDDNPFVFAFGWGVINFLCAIPAFYTIDTIGRRSLLLFTFPFLAIFQLLTAAAFIGNATSVTPQHANGTTASQCSNATIMSCGASVSTHNDIKITDRWPLAIVGMYLFGVVYSFGMGPAPFVYASESMPLYVRDIGMGFVTSFNWLFDWLVSFTALFLIRKLNYFGAFLFYAGSCLVLEVLIFIFVRETRILSLEQLDDAFRIPTSDFVWKFAIARELKWFLNPRSWWKTSSSRPVFHEFIREYWQGSERERVRLMTDNTTAEFLGSSNCTTEQPSNGM